jgi:L-threonylcarbamoyladenylate synthase
MKTEIIRADHPTAVSHAVDTLKHGGLVAFPTDTVYGLASLPFHAEMVERLYVAKGIVADRAIAILLGDLSQLDLVVDELPVNARTLAERYWPGPLTLIVPRRKDMPESLVHNLGIGVRIPNHPVALQLLRRAGPLAVTSANLSGRGMAKNAREVLEQLDGRIHLILDGGDTPQGVPSTVVDCSSGEAVVLRGGPIATQDLQKVINIGGNLS